MVDRLIAAGLADRQTNPGNRRETLLRLRGEGRRMVEALTACNEAGGEPLASALDDRGPHPLGWVADAGGDRDA